MKIALGQIKVVPGEPEQNVERMIAAMQKAANEATELIAFPEMCVGGYLVGDLWLDDAYCRDLMTYNKQIAQAAKTLNIAVAYGNVYLSDTIKGKDGRMARFNAAYVFDSYGEPAKRENYVRSCRCSSCKGDEIPSPFPTGVQPKTNLPNYRFFDDQRYFYSATDISARVNKSLTETTAPFIINREKIGVCLCEDLWCDDYVKYNRTVSPARFYVQNGASIILNLSTSPWTHGKNTARDKRVVSVMSDANSAVNKSNAPFNRKRIDFYGYVNCVGVQNNGKNILTFDGGSTFYNFRGEIIRTHRNPHMEDIIYIETKHGYDKIEREKRDVINEKANTIVESIKNFVPDNMNVIIGLSGGIDSALVTTLCYIALGKKRVIAVNMPSEYNSDTTKNAAAKLAEGLGITYRIVPISSMVDANILGLKSANLPQENSDIPDLVEENLQAKIRGTSLLSNLAQMSNALFMNCGNKVEVAIGYATLYGDWGGALSPIGDLTKTEVYEMAKYINELWGNNIIPQDIFNIPPSAELKNDQVDPIKVGYHCALVKMMTNYKITSAEQIMQWWLDGTLEDNLDITNKMLESFGLINSDVFLNDLKWFFSRERGSVFKRVQSVPIVVTSKTAYGYDRRESIMPKYKWTRAASELATRIQKQTKYTSRLSE
jgi:NAD+ synthase (glutamine-hydrolysing)